jgi:hypothetical protein
MLAIASGVAAHDGLALMKVEPGARPAGMGGAFSSIAADAYSAAYNPAAGSGAERFQASFGHNTYWDNVHIETGYALFGFTERTWLHGGIRYAGITNLEARTGPSSTPEDVFDAYDVSFKGGLSYRIMENLYAGAAIGLFVEKIDRFSGSTFNADLGLLYRSDKGYAIGASALNLGSDFELSAPGEGSSDQISLPTSYRVGGSYRYGQYLGALDLVVLDDDLHAHLGAEAWLHEMLAVRAGYQAGYDTKDFTAGASIVYRNLSIDYAFVPYSNDLGTSHLFNLTASL